MDAVRVVVVGGGAAGVVAAAHLVQADGWNAADVVLVERAETVGPGLAYRTQEPLHLLNNYACRMSALEHDPTDLLRWCAAEGLAVRPESFVPRSLYGRYVARLLDRLAPAPGCCLRRARGTALDVADAGEEYTVRLDSGQHLHADAVVLATGNPPPRDLPAIRAKARAWASDPWAPGLTGRVNRGGRVLLVGTGLTAVDVAVQLAAAHHDVELVACSRHGLLPLTHRDQPTSLSAGAESGRASDLGPARLATLLRQLRGRRAALGELDEDWRDLVEEVRSRANELWSGLAPESQGAFLRHVARYWEVARHRMAPAVAAQVEGLLLEGRLTVTTPERLDVESFDLVVNCTGPGPACAPGWNPVLDAMTARGEIRPDRHGLGFEITGPGRLVNRSGRAARGLYLMGTGRRGTEWEVAAVPDLRRQAVAVVDALRKAPANRSLGVLAG